MFRVRRTRVYRIPDSPLHPGRFLTTIVIFHQGDDSALKHPTDAGTGSAIAIIGMACRFPGADDPGQFWRNLAEGRDSITFFTPQQGLDAGLDPALVRHPDYVAARGVLDGVGLFDAAFFGCTAREAQVMDPQHRFFLTCAWEALEQAGYATGRTGARIGVFASTYRSTYLQHYLLRNPEIFRLAGGYQVKIGNNPDFMPTLVSFKLDLRGPSVNVNTACSSSLVAVQLGCQSLRTGESDLVLAGACQITLPQERGQVCRQGMIFSPMGHCRPFDADADGIVLGSGTGVVALKRLAEAQADRDTILAVIRAAAVNNDGGQKHGYTAPSAEGQARVVAAALAQAGVSADDITYVEAHGTGTLVGDPVEVEALTAAFQPGTRRTGYCGLGSVKSNVGHLIRTAGMAGLVKTVLALRQRQIPPSLNFRKPNSKINFAASPFRVVTSLEEWNPDGRPRLAGVSSFGIGGTNAHVILEEAPPQPPTEPSRERPLLALSARSEAALAEAGRRLARHLEENPDLPLADVAFTLAVGRKEFPHRRVVEASTSAEAAAALRSPDAGAPDDLSRRWVAGEASDWAARFAGERRSRVPLPTYPFEPQRFWVDPVLPATRPATTASVHPVAESAPAAPALLRPVWREAPLVEAAPGEAAGGPVLIFQDPCGVGRKLAERLELAGVAIFSVTPGATFARPAPNEFTLDPGRPEEYDALLRGLAGAAAPPRRIVHLWGIAPPDPDPFSEESTRAAIERGLHSLVALAQALGRLRTEASVRLLAGSTGAVAAIDGDAVAPGRAAALGAVRLIPHEYAQVDCRGVDLPFPAEPADVAAMAGILRRELAAGGVPEVVAWRDGWRLARRFESAGEGPPQGLGEVLRPGGVYLLTGGTGAVGFTLARRLARECRAKLVLTARSPFPDRSEWRRLAAGKGPETATVRRIREMLELERDGAEFLVLAADVTDRRRMREVVEAATQRFGAIHGVIHAAGAADPHGVIQNRTPAQTEAILAPKMAGALILDEIFRGRKLAFLALCSSMAVVRYAHGFGQVGYCAANEFLDAFAAARTARGGGRTVSINWDAWREEGMAVEAVRRRAARSAGRPGSAAPGPHPLLGECIESSPERLIYERRLTSEDPWFLAEHRLRGVPLIPGTAYLQWAAALTLLRTGRYPIEIRSACFTVPLRVPAGEARVVRLTLEAILNGHRFTAVSREASRPNGWVEHACADLPAAALDDPRTGQPSVSLEGLDWRPPETAPPRSDGLAFGPRWDCARELAERDGGRWIRLVLPPPFHSELADFPLHPALLDRATGFASPPDTTGGTFLPFAYDRLRILGPLPSRLISRARAVREGADKATETRAYDLTLLDETGRVVAEIEGYTLRRLESPDEAGQPGDATSNAVRPAEPGNRCLVVGAPGRLDSLAWRSCPRRSPGPGEVEIRVAAAGLNFKDVLLALDLVPPASEGELAPGLECAGTVTRVGEGVTAFRPGDEVMAPARPGFAAYATVDARMASTRPAGWTLAQAAAVPVAYGTAWYALMTVGRLQPGERVLIHAAAGGVGLAAVHICRWRGCEIFATAGRPDKHEYLRSLGIRHVMSSRTLDFAGEVMERTGGRGVDVVLNSLAGDFIPAGLSVLAPFGRFLEIGIRDVLADTRIGLKPFARGLIYALILAGPDTPGYAAAWQEMAALVRDGRLPPLPVRTFPAGEVRQAFEFMVQARHIGKIVVEKTADPVGAPADAETGQVPTGMDDLSPGRLASPTPQGVAELAAPSSEPVSGLTNAEGAEAFLRVLGLGLPQVAVCLSPPDEAEGSRKRPTDVGGVLATAAPMPSQPRQASRTGYIPPRSELEQALVQIWENTLGIQPVGIHDNFFDLGGDSLVAVTLFDAIRQALGRGLQISLLFEAPTIARMAEVLGGGPPAPVSSPDPGPVSRLSSDATRPEDRVDTNAPAPSRDPSPDAAPPNREGLPQPLVFVHNIYGEILVYRAITRHLLPEFQVHPLAAPIAGESYRQCQSVEELAAGYIRRLQADLPEGPCLLLGHSVGGLLAFEMARQLAAAGREVPFLGLLDARLIRPPDGFRRFADPACLGHWLRNLPHWAARFAHSRGKRWSLVRERFHHLLGMEDPEWHKTIDPAHAEYMCWLMGLLRRYQPTRYGGRVVLFRIRTLPLLSWSREDMGWGCLTRTAPEVRFIPGDHATMLREPDVLGLAAQIKSSLAPPPHP